MTTENAPVTLDAARRALSALHRWDCGRPAHEFNEPLAVLDAFLAASPATGEGLDVERLARAIDAHYQSEATHPFHDCAEMIAAEYARLSTPTTEEPR